MDNEIDSTIIFYKSLTVINKEMQVIDWIKEANAGKWGFGRSSWRKGRTGYY